MRSVLRATVLLAVLGFVGCGSGTSPTAPSSPAGSDVAKAYLSKVLDTMQASSINRYTIDWTAFRQSVNQAAPNPQTIADTYPAISVALGLLNDHHSFFMKPDGSYVYNPNPLPACSDLAPPLPSVPPDIGYVWVGATTSSGGTSVDFAVAVQKRIAAADNRDLKGWIVDLRGNGGGNMWPMIAGLGPILGEGTAGAFVDPDNQVVWWAYANGASTNDGQVRVQVPAPYALLEPSPRVAVLTNCGVASSGEATVIAFRGRPNTRSFGTPTRGLSTANSGFPMNDGASLVLTVSLMADRNLTRYGGAVPPDEVVADPARHVERAVEWLRAF
jgi:carboxyl-terminal processing protease